MRLPLNFYKEYLILGLSQIQSDPFYTLCKKHSIYDYFLTQVVAKKSNRLIVNSLTLFMDAPVLEGGKVRLWRVI